MKCPKCGFEQQQSDECLKCGIIIAKFLRGKLIPTKVTLKKNSLKTVRTSSSDAELREYYLGHYQLANAGFTPFEAHRSVMKGLGASRNKVYRRIELELEKGEPASKGMLMCPAFFPESHVRLIAMAYDFFIQWHL